MELVTCEQFMDQFVISLNKRFMEKGLKLCATERKGIIAGAVENVLVTLPEEICMEVKQDADKRKDSSVLGSDDLSAFPSVLSSHDLYCLFMQKKMKIENLVDVVLYQIEDDCEKYKKGIRKECASRFHWTYMYLVNGKEIYGYRAYLPEKMPSSDRGIAKVFYKLSIIILLLMFGLGSIGVLSFIM